MEELAAEWRVGRQLAAALCLCQPYLPGGAVARTAQLLAVLQVCTAGALHGLVL